MIVICLRSIKCTIFKALQNDKIVIQARTHSTRLPQKVVKPFFNGHTILDILCKRLLLYYNASQVIIAGSKLDEESEIANIAQEHGIEVYWGDENDVLKRMINAAEKKYGEDLIRVCADNPFLDIETMAQLCDSGKGYDYCAFQYSSGKPSILGHSGLFAEYASLAALKKAHNSTNEKLFREHVSNYLYTNPEQFKLKFIEIPKEIEENQWIRLTVDSASDFEIAQDLFAQLIESSGWKFNYKDIINLVLKTNGFREKMEHNIQLNTKV